jgi:hypothetical protein
MTDPNRLVDEGSPWGKAVLRSAADEAPPPHLRRALHAAVAAGAVGAGVAGASTATAATATTATTTATTKTASVLASLSLAKWAGVVAVGAAASAGAHALTRPAEVAPPPPAAAPAAPRVTQAGPRAASVPWQEVAEAPMPKEERTPIAAAPLASTKSAARAVAPSSARPFVPEDSATEVLAIDGARASLAAGDFAGTVERLNRYDLDFPHGRLRPESLAVRIQAYAGKPDPARAKDLARQFLVEYPSHPFAAHARALLEESRP